MPAEVSRSVRQAVVLAAGGGERMRRPSPGVTLRADQEAAAANGFKALVPIGARPFLDHALSELLAVGIERVVVVVGPKSPLPSIALCSEGALALRFAVQAEPLGSAHALLAAADLVGDQSFLALNGDNFYPARALRDLLDCDDENAVLGLDREAVAADPRSNLTLERMGAFAALEASPDGFLRHIAEKPKDVLWQGGSRRLLVGVNAWRFEPSIFAACREVEQSPRGELELPSAVQNLLRSGLSFRVVRSRAPVLDLTRRADIPVVERLLIGRPGELVR